LILATGRLIGEDFGHPLLDTCLCTAALHGLTQMGELTSGTRALVESMKKHLNTSYADLARRAKVSVAGLTRWRSNDSGDTSKLARLVSIATALAAEDVAVETGTTSSASAVTFASVMEAIKARPLQQIEEQLHDALESALSTSIEACSLCNLEMMGSTAKLTLMLK